MVSIVIPNYNGAQHLSKCLDSLAEQTFQEFVVIIVDNNSTDESFNVVSQSSLNVQWVEQLSNLGFARAVNLGVELCESKYVFVLNNDTALDPDALKVLVNYFEENKNENLFCVQPLMLRMNEPSLVDDAGDHLSWYGVASKGMHLEPNRDIKTMPIFSPSGGASFFRTDKFRSLGGFDILFNSYLEDVDLGLRAKIMGYKSILVSDAVIYHVGGGSQIRKSVYYRNMTRNRILIFAKNIPKKILIKKLPELLYGQVFHFLSYAHPLASMKGIFDIFKMKKHIKDSRRALLGRASLNHSEIEKLLTNDFPRPNLLQAFLDFMYNLFLRPILILFR